MELIRDALAIIGALTALLIFAAIGLPILDAIWRAIFNRSY